MKTKNLFLLPALIALLNLLPAGRVTAQTFTTLHGFTPIVVVDDGHFHFTSTNSDGATPYAGLITNSSGTTLYGTANRGGSSGNGTVFAVNTDGTGFTNLHSFAATPDPYYTNSDGAGPNAGLLLSGNTLYGTALYGGSSGEGTVFAVNTDGTGFTNLHSFTALSNYTNSDGAYPNAGLILSGNTLYGTAYQGGSLGVGTVFAVNTDGTGFTNLHSFASYPSDGGYDPNAGLILSGNTLYGTALNGGYSTNGGGSSGSGTVFTLNTDGTGFTNLHTFTTTYFNYTTQNYTNSDGGGPGELILSGNTLYGTAFEGGSPGAGTVFALNTDGTGFTNLHNFAGYPSDGASPRAGLILSGNTLYGTASAGGSSSNGTVFTLNTDGTGFTNLHNFAGYPSDGTSPRAGLVLSGNTLYGTASGGGSAGNGTVFSLSFRPQLTIALSDTNVVLSWPISYAGFSYAGYYLEETANLGSATGWISAADTNAPVIVNGQLRVTRPMLGPQWAYRLRKL